MQKLTRKQTIFVQQVLNGKSGTQAALAAYDTADPAVAKVISSQNLTKLNVREALDEALRLQGLSPSILATNIGTIANSKPEKISAETVLKANIELLKLQGAYADNKSTISQSIAFNIQTMTLEQIEAELKQTHILGQELLAEANK